MKCVDLLSDTTYREQAIKQVDALLNSGGNLPVERSQIYGLRQIARQQPRKVKTFAEHQKERAQKRDRGAEVDFWELVSNCCDSTQGWSVQEEGKKYLPKELKEIPPKQKGMTHDQRRHRNELLRRCREWIEQWDNDHIPAFFERFCTHALYREGTAKK